MNARLPCLLAAALCCACLPSPQGRCASDAECTAGPPGSFCAEGVCQGPPLLTAPAPPTGTFARSASVQLSMQVTRAHGGVERAAVHVETGALRVDAIADGAGSFHADLPLSFAPAAADGDAAYSIVASDDLGHTVRLDQSIHVDDAGPVIAIDSTSIPATPVVRGTLAQVQVTLTDSSPALSATSSTNGGPARPATALGGGRFAIDVETARASPAATEAQAIITATDALGSASQTQVSVPITRVRWRTMPSSPQPISGLVLGADNVLAIASERLFVAARSTGLASTFSSGLLVGLASPATDGTHVFTTVADGRVCNFAQDGTVLWCCGPLVGLSGALALGALPLATDPLQLLAATDASSTPGRIFSLNTTTSVCDERSTLAVAGFELGSPEIAPSGLVVAAASDRLVSAHFDGLAWATRSDPLDVAPTGLALGETTSEGQLAVLSTATTGTLRALRLPPLGSDGLPAGEVTELFRTLIAASSAQSIGAPVIASDGSIVSTGGHLLVALDPQGAIRWSVPTPGAVGAPPVLGAGGLIYLVTNDGSLSAFSLSSGALVWQLALGAASSVAPAIGCDGALYVGTRSGELISIVVDAPGLDNGPWPRQGHDVRATADGRRAMRDGAGGCLE